MATKKTVEVKAEEKKEPIKPVVLADKKIRMLTTYCGSAGSFFKGNVYTVNGAFAKELLKNKEAEEC